MLKVDEFEWFFGIWALSLGNGIKLRKKNKSDEKISFLILLYLPDGGKRPGAKSKLQ